MENISIKDGAKYVDVLVPLQNAETNQFARKIHLSVPDTSKVFCGRTGLLFHNNQTDIDWVNQSDIQDNICKRCKAAAIKYLTQCAEKSIDCLRDSIAFVDVKHYQRLMVSISETYDGELFWWVTRLTFQQEMEYLPLLPKVPEDVFGGYTMFRFQMIPFKQELIGLAAALVPLTQFQNLDKRVDSKLIRLKKMLVVAHCLLDTYDVRKNEATDEDFEREDDAIGIRSLVQSLDEQDPECLEYKDLAQVPYLVRHLTTDHAYKVLVAPLP